MMMTSVFRFCWRALVVGVLASVVSCQSDVPAKGETDAAARNAAEAEALRGVVTDGTPQEMAEAAIARNQATIRAFETFQASVQKLRREMEAVPLADRQQAKGYDALENWLDAYQAKSEKLLTEARALEAALQAQSQAGGTEMEGGASDGDALTGLMAKLEELNGALPDFSEVDKTIIEAVKRLKNAGGKPTVLFD